MEIDSDIAQPQTDDSASPADASPSQQDDDKVPTGVQRRIDELTGLIHDLRRSSTAKDEQIAALTQAIASRAQPHTEEPQDDFSDIDPDDMKRFGKMFKAANRGVAREIAQLREQLARATAQVAHSTIGRHEDPDVRDEAMKLVAAWQKQNVYGTVANDEDAILIAEAKVARKRKAEGRDPRRSALSAANEVGGTRAPATTRRTNGVDLSAMSVEDVASRLEELSKNPEYDEFEL